ncbi:MAG: hypothetical protein NC910_04475 [Candidatus Omnitrophica bacterium]|nr:hypothetical protein [Candidatus Omnitrophota bacterium]
MVADRSTAEERLLKLIEDPSGIRSAALSFSSSKEGWLGIFARFGRRGSSFRRRRSEDEFLERIRLSSRLLWIVLLALGVYVVRDVMAPYETGKKAPLNETIDIRAPGGQTSEKPEDYMRPVSVYIGSADVRTPFETTVKKIPDVRATASPQVENLADGLTVVGIDRSGTPRALIEDAKGGRTYFVGVGEEVNGMMVKEVTAHGVVLERDGKEIRLSY